MVQRRRRLAVMPPRVVLATTIDVSLSLMKGLPEALVARGWDVHVVSSGGPRLSELAETRGVTVHAIAMRRNPSPLRDAVAIIQWYRLLREVRPDVLSVGTPKASLLGLLAARLARVPSRQYVLRGLRLETARGPLRPILLATEMISVAASTDVVAVSESLRRKAVASGIARKRAISVIGEGSSNGVDLTQYDPSRFPEEVRVELRSRLGLDASSPVVGFVGRITHDKGIGALVAAVLRSRQSGIACQLLVVGATEDAVVAREMDRVRAAGIPVVVTGHIPDPAPYIALFSALCLPSLREGFSNAALEAAAMGVPVVATTATGIVDPVADGENGLLSPIGDVDALTRNLIKVLTDSQLARRLGESGRLRAERFERSAVQAAFESRLRHLLET
ncbi:glycosyltransferase [Microbacterium sp. RD1]|uniref:glycosyltransferase n=1 Tax=Microbacterium sp. RD1 TaxID=3457313 RepID=UPI003FA608BE